MKLFHFSPFRKRPLSDQHIPLIESKVLASLQSQNVRKANMLSAQFLFAYILLAAIAAYVNHLEQYEECYLITVTILFPCGGVSLIILLVGHLMHFKGKYLPYFLVGAMVLTSNLHYFVYPFYTGALLLLPIIATVRYYNRSFTLLVACVHVSAFMLTCGMGIWLDQVNPEIYHLHDWMYAIIWHYPQEAFWIELVPNTAILIFGTVCTCQITSNGRDMLHTVATDTDRISAISAELKMAAEIQQSVLPPADFTAADDRLTLCAVEKPTKETSGDFYDYFMLDENRLAFLIADVSDKGAPAALFMMSAKKAIRCALESCQSLEDAVRVMGKLICLDNKSEMFLTLWLGVLDLRSGYGKYINAGHPYPLVCHQGQARFWQNEPDLFLGILPDEVPAVHPFHLCSGDQLLLYTDGVTDAINTQKQSFGTEGLLDILQDGRSLSPEELRNQIMYRLRIHKGTAPQFDDITLLILQYHDAVPPQSLELKLESNALGQQKAQAAVAALLKNVSCPETVCQNIGVVMDEILDNINCYAYAEGEGEIRLKAEVGSNYIILRFADKGPAFNPLEEQEPDLDDLERIGGLGIHLVRNLTDRISYRRENEMNRLQIWKIWGI